MIRIETVDRSPKEGQHCGQIPTGVRVTHVETGLSAYCDFKRSQMANRQVALAMLEYGLAELGVTDPG